MVDFVCIYMPKYSAKLVDSALESGKIYDDEGFKYIRESFPSGTLHLIGLLSDGGVHSRLDQLQVCPFLSHSSLGFLLFLDGLGFTELIDNNNGDVVLIFLVSVVA